jgi:hypothetical protein
VAYHGTRETAGFWSGGGPPLKLRLVGVGDVLVGLEGILVLLPLHVHVRLVGVVGAVAGVFALLLLLLDLVL